MESFLELEKGTDGRRLRLSKSALKAKFLSLLPLLDLISPLFPRRGNLISLHYTPPTTAAAILTQSCIWTFPTERGPNMDKATITSAE